MKSKKIHTNQVANSEKPSQFQLPILLLLSNEFGYFANVFLSSNVSETKLKYGKHILQAHSR